MAEDGKSPFREGRILLVLAVVLYALRFLRLGDTPFINDEPQLQLALDRHLAEGRLPTHGLQGTRSVVYGPMALWAYMPVRLLTDDVALLAAWHAAIFAAGVALLYLAVRRSCGSIAAGWTVALAASSPYLFMYARLCWDNTFLVFTVGLLGFFAARLDAIARHGVVTPIGLGLAAGLAFDTHLMSLPAIGAAAFLLGVALAREGSWPLAVRASAFFVLAFTAVTVVYLVEVLPTLLGSGEFRFTASGLRVVPTAALGTMRYLSAAGFEYFFDAPFEAFTGSYLAAPVRWLIRYDVSWVLRAAGWVLLLLVLVRPRRFAGQPVMLQLAAVTVVAMLFYYYGVRPDLGHPHYFMAVWWLGFVLAAMAIARAGRRLGLLLRVAAGLTLLVNVVFVLQTGGRLAEERGTRGIHHGSAHGEIRRATAEICAALQDTAARRAAVDLSAVPGVMPPSVQYFFSRLEACRGKALVWQSAAADSGVMRAALVYGTRSPGDASLLVRLDFVR